MSQPQLDFEDGVDDEAIVDPEGTYTVGELAEVINRRIRGGEDGLWVRGEIQGWNARGPHAYFTLADDAADTPDAKAVIDVAVFAPSRNRLRPMLERHRLRLGDGIKVRIYGYLDFYAPRGQIKLVMTGIDPRFTLGDLAQQRDQVMRRLVAGGLVDANRRTPLGRAPVHVGVVTSVGSAAWHDFHQELAASGLGFQLSVCDVRVQGDHAVAMVAAAIASLAARPLDAIVVIRGGGARNELSVFDAEPIALAIAASPVPVLTGLGHEVDRSIADEVAYASYKTPTACAQALVGDDRDVPGRGRARLRARPRRGTRRHRASRRGARRPRPPHRPAHPGRRRSCRGGPRPTAWPAAHRCPAGARRRRLAGRTGGGANPGAAAAGAHRREPGTSSRCTPAPAPSTRS